MAKVIEHKKYVCTSALNNNNKFWEYILYDNGEVLFKYGRVGEKGAETTKVMTRSQLDSKIREKTNRSKPEDPPYREVPVVLETQPTGPSGPTGATKIIVKEAAVQQLAGGDKVLTPLIEMLVEANRHELHAATGGSMSIDLKTGMVTTPLGVLHKDSVTAGRKHLLTMEKYVLKRDFENPKFIETLDSYLMLIPQDVGTRSRGWYRNFMVDATALQNQNTLLDQLDASADLADARLKQAALGNKDGDKLPAMPSIFDAKIQVVSDRHEIERITKMFKESINSRHTSSRMRPVKFYEVSLNNANAAFARDGAKLTNIWQLWHGTRKFNVLSILKNSLIVPPSGGSYQVTGRMFGDGVYGSDQSTKALNYAQGYWDGGKKDKNCFMFLVDFAMGNYHVPSGTTHRIPSGYDSCFAKANKSGVMNNEMIVYRTSQVRPRYLIEFEE